MQGINIKFKVIGPNQKKKHRNTPPIKKQAIQIVINVHDKYMCHCKA